DMLGLHPEERGHALSLLVRAMFTQSASAIERANGVRSFVAQVSAAGTQPEISSEMRPLTIAAPLTADHWRDALELPDKADLFAALISNRPAMLVSGGLMATDPSTRAMLERDRGLFKWILKTAPAAFWISARSFKVEKDRVIVPGGPAAEPIWEALVDVKVTRPVEFLRSLLTRDSGRVAWFYDTIGSFPQDRLAAALGPAPVQLDRVRMLYSAFRSADSNWKLEEHPFLRGTTDPWIVTSQIAVIDGAVAPPAEQWFWELLFDRSEVSRKAAAAASRQPATPATLAWVVEKISESSAKERRDRFEMVRFAQGVFKNLDGEHATEALIALGGYRRYRAALVTLDRMGVSTPRVYARIVEAARRLDGDLSGRDERHAVIAFQSAIAILERARFTEQIRVADAERLLLSIAEVIDPPNAQPSKTRPVDAITQWMIATMLAALPPLVQPDQWTGARTAYESRLLQALAGRPTEPDAPSLKWEGLDYRVDWFGGEHARLKRIREQIESPGLDAALEEEDAEKISHALLTLIYTPALGDPEGPALLGGDIAQRHDFGLVGPAGMRRDFVAWAMPREQVGDGSPWRVEGSILGLDIALARLALRRIADNEMPGAPSINLNDQLTFARTVMTINPRSLHDADRDRLVAAIERGRARVKAAGANLPAVMELAAEAQLSPAIRQTLQWTLTRSPEAVPALFGLRDLLWLGKPDLPQETLDHWGIYSETLESRARTALARPAPWENFGGRADGGLVATQAPDLVLRMAEETARLQLPAQLVPGLLMYAAQDYWHDVESRFPDDWAAMTRQALALSPSRVEDYVAALAGSGPLRPR
ncbi:MAG TPA: hypothetical protein VFZ31_04520, partial [Vicinamibacterales bacterium]